MSEREGRLWFAGVLVAGVLSWCAIAASALLGGCGTEHTTAPDAPHVYYCRAPHFGAPCQTPPSTACASYPNGVCPDAAPACLTQYGRPCLDAGTDAAP